MGRREVVAERELAPPKHHCWEEVVEQAYCLRPAGVRQPFLMGGQVEAHRQFRVAAVEEEPSRRRPQGAAVELAAERSPWARPRSIRPWAAS